MDDIKLKVLLDEWYIAMRDRQEDKAIKLKEKVEDLYSKGGGHAYKKLLQLMQIRFHLMIKDYQNVLFWFNELGSERDVPDDMKYYYHKFNGIFMMDNGKYPEALSSFLRAETFVNDLFNSTETAECKYRLALAYFRLSDNSKSMKEASKGLELFRKEKNELGIALCENVLGLNSTVIKQFHDAEAHYQFVRRYAEKYDHQHMKCMIYLNLGDLFSDLKLPHTAIDYLKKAYYYTRKKDYFYQVRISYLLAKQHFIVGDCDEASQMAENGMHISIKCKNEEYQHHFKMLIAKFQPELTEVEQVYKDGLDYFKKNQLWRMIHEYSEELAIFYQNQKRYPEAVMYYDFSIQARKTIEKKGLDDL